MRISPTSERRRASQALVELDGRRTALLRLVVQWQSKDGRGSLHAMEPRGMRVEFIVHTSQGSGGGGGE